MDDCIRTYRFLFVDRVSGLSDGDERLTGMDGEFFERVADVVRGALPRDLGTPQVRPRHNGIKVWFGDAAKEHYEAQVIRPDGVPGARSFAVEVGFHVEYGKAEQNDEILARLRAAEHIWRPELGDDAVLGDFLGHSVWRRLSETWPDPDASDIDLAFEVGVRLVDYLHTLEPLRKSQGKVRPPAP